MFVVPAVLLPLILAMALVRLYRIPRQLWRGEFRLPGKRRPLLHAATVLAYLVLLGWTLMLVSALVHALLRAGEGWGAFLALWGYAAAYPLVYLGAAWVFYYGLRPAAGPDAPASPGG